MAIVNSILSTISWLKNEFTQAFISAAHEKTVLFFTHCGMHGILEALHYGVPMVGMPVFADQQDVLMRLQERGVARGVHKEASEDEIFQAINDVLEDSR